MKRIFNIANVMFIVALAVTFMPSKRAESAEYALYLAGVIVLIHAMAQGKRFMSSDEDKKQSVCDVIAIIYACIVFWEVITSKLDRLEPLLFPGPGKVVFTFIQEIPYLLEGLLSSMKLLSAGYVLALVTAVPLALVIGWRRRLFRAVNPFTKVLGPIPPIVYIPYAIALLPTFTSASIFIIFIGAFWPIFINTLNGAFDIDKKYVDSAKVLNVDEKTMLFKIILPGIMPSIISGATIGLVLSFILLTAAEMIGASSGLGWYVKYFSDFADYPKVVVGIIFIGMVVTGITYFSDKLEKRLLAWKN
ncbi:NitT/TauT family transport system permease protein [Peptoclostridium litorale DSM 5388]|uniref:Binding-protein-dependent transport systems inner membrane component n=1 Tax=Peptoclostridium litorale DSM 5388 TaxID=1121324 RepID=A0A069RJ96_PEPLI|nr:ABC transporter permease [Peptoclostridium litorale]KDR96205.1 binding-protein-dependent transport systems inner membrane component [Peptoclostridium litorale DSM 5388]SIO13559.1 NitT/TauT family transport system permease protein [Peptoclostridium litorale DSM 5388]